MASFKKGDFVEFDGLLAVVIGTEDDPYIPQEHGVLWFGAPEGKRISQGGIGGAQPEVWLIPEQYCSRGRTPEYLH